MLKAWWKVMSGSFGKNGGNSKWICCFKWSQLCAAANWMVKLNNHSNILPQIGKYDCDVIALKDYIYYGRIKNANIFSGKLKFTVEISYLTVFDLWWLILFSLFKNFRSVHGQMFLLDRKEK